MKYLANKYGDEQFTVFGQFSYDVKEAEKKTNKELAACLNKLGYIDDQGQNTIPNMKFLEKIDINGPSMHDLYKFAKRNSPNLFVSRLGQATHIYDYNCKFLFDKYGTVRNYYSQKTELAKIEADIKELLRQEFVE